MTENDLHCTHEIMMRRTIDEALSAAARGEVPIGAVLIDNVTGEMIAQNSNRTIEKNDPTAHAEILCIREACRQINNQRLSNATLYVTLEPCTMCAAAIAFARIEHLVIGAKDPKGGGVFHGAKFFDQPTCHHKISVTSGIHEDKCAQILKDFFKKRRR